MTTMQNHKTRNTDQWSGTGSPDLYGQLMCDKGSKNIQWGKDSHFNKQCCGNWTDTCKKKKTRLLYETIYKNKLKMD